MPSENKRWREIGVESERLIQRIDITRQVARAVAEIGAGDGAAVISVPHTTAAVTVGENWDDDLVPDIEEALAALVPRIRFRHGEGNGPAHLLSEITGTSCIVPLENGALALGQWQGIFLLELDGPRQRRIRVLVLGA